MRDLTLTDRDRRILDLLAAGWSARAIATDLGLSYFYTRNVCGVLYEKLGVSSRTQAAVWWVRQTEKEKELPHA